MKTPPLTRRDSLTRRDFLEAAGAGAALLAAPASLLGAAETASGMAGEPRLKGFIVSDAHFGYRDPQQPKVEESRRAMENIVARFPDLDVFVDTGDAHHSDAGDADRGNWTDVVAGGCGPLPLLYCMGNHEHGHEKLGDGSDTEARSYRLGSLSCRTYQSWTLKGVHFVAAPQLLNAVYVTEELLEWLELDLSVHRDLTTIIFSHNSLKGTTDPDYDFGYRLVVNSRQVLALLRRYPNVIAWMHGHNHNWDLVPAMGKFFVSNGRLGGFDIGGPGGSGMQHIGGVYFELGPEHFTVRGYSASRGKFFDEFDPASRYMHQRMSVRTSLDPQAPAAVCYGQGRARHGQRVPVYRHHALAEGGRSEVFLAAVAAPAFNENSAMQWFSQRNERDGKKMQKSLAGYAVTPQMSPAPEADPTWQWTNPGLRLKALEDSSQRRAIQVPGAKWGKYQYYRCAPGSRLRVEIDSRCEQPGPRLQLVCYFCDSHGQERAKLVGPWWDLTPEAQVRAREFQLPDLPDAAGIYRAPASDTELQVHFEAILADLRSDVLVARLEVRFADAQGGTRDAALRMDGQKATAAGELAVGEIYQQPWNSPTLPRSVAEVAAGGSRLVTWLVRETGLRWQVRNAPAVTRDGWLEIGKLRNSFSPRQEIVIAPLGEKPALYVHKLRKVAGARILAATPDRPAVSVELREVTGTAEVEMIAPAKPRRVEGADRWSFQEGRILLSKASPGIIRVEA